MTTFYRILLSLSLLVGLASCQRATYSFASQAAYHLAPATQAPATPTSASAVAEATPTPPPVAEAASSYRAQRRPRRVQAHLTPPAARAQPPVAALLHRRALFAAQRQRATPTAALVPATAASDIGQALVMVAILFCVAVVVGVLVVAKLAERVIEQKSQKSARSVAPHPAL